MTTDFNKEFQTGTAPTCAWPSSNTGRAWERSDWPLELEESRCISEAASSIARRGKIYKQMRQGSSKMRRYQHEQIRTQPSKLNRKGKGVLSFPPITPPLFHPGTGCQIPGRKKSAAGSNRKHWIPILLPLYFQ